MQVSGMLIGAALLAYNEYSLRNAQQQLLFAQMLHRRDPDEYTAALVEERELALYQARNGSHVMFWVGTAVFWWPAIQWAASFFA